MKEKIRSLVLLAEIQVALESVYVCVCVFVRVHFMFGVNPM